MPRYWVEEPTRLGIKPLRTTSLRTARLATTRREAEASMRGAEQLVAELAGVAGLVFSEASPAAPWLRVRLAAFRPASDSSQAAHFPA